ncbi:PP2C family protein-serine/threonine phosphatase [Acidomonas methanolica]|uniref:Protein phosphatase n=1 Tax=Acidomonas methanolica NBRC 104435 TaxID=1231351 RepID=A0A023D9S8_ACIMT|nr:protein phosphatase 2C domain-containing protein [Acidomonas methanolica]MBU2652784.1 protein phosphatase 2C domain-containing protein [Acidomonas methanolica]TCS31187.1 protein phosphatase/serine/threonine-protein phosphatase Stp1 [Acidomonas methanolica]GAJ30460.1 protein phosphatase [Acidomonas methanolica NBRC 104435]GBQ49771.1 serine/threonine protein phosphatase [Acidomonas methanolica]GEK98565.1 serine/threonine protein phosphatase [Acidomonas methanolica NBRC 104435]
MAALREHSYHATHKGPFRTENQDALVCRPDIGVYAVADGAGGHKDGRFAATTVIDAIAALPPWLPPEERLPALRQAVDDAHRRLKDFAGEGKRGAVSTLVTLLLAGDYFVVLWAGDSRVYLLRDNEMIQLTHDHTLVQQMVDSGSLSADESWNHPRANIITRAVGSAEPDFKLDKCTGVALPNDRFLLCSDGLLKAMDEDEICHLLGQDGDVAEAMLTTALRRRARDNVSVVVVVRP